MTAQRAGPRNGRSGRVLRAEHASPSGTVGESHQDVRMGTEFTGVKHWRIPSAAYSFPQPGPPCLQHERPHRPDTRTRSTVEAPGSDRTCKRHLSTYSRLNSQSRASADCTFSDHDFGERSPESEGPFFPVDETRCFAIRVAGRYGALRVSELQRQTVLDYIGSQAEHRRKWSYEQEFLTLVTLVRKSGVEYDPRYLFG
jgi:hypothetical protein